MIRQLLSLPRGLNQIYEYLIVVQDGEKYLELVGVDISGSVSIDIIEFFSKPKQFEVLQSTFILVFECKISNMGNLERTVK